MLRYVIVILLALLPAMSFAADPVSRVSEEVVHSLQQSYPKLRYSEISPAPVDDLYELVMPDDNVLYYAAKNRLIMTGEIWTPDGRNLTVESKDRRLSAKLDLLDLDKAIKIGNGPNLVIEVTDPDCPFCRKGAQFLAGREDVTQYIFFYPLTRIHPQAEAKSRFILAAEDPAGAYEDVVNGMYDNQPLPEFTDNGLLEEQLEIAQSVGVNSTPQYWINGQHVSGFNQQKIEQLLTK